jgi:tetrapyrrole methylase family protein / MazG family protein
MNAREIVVVGLGPGDPGLLTMATALMLGSNRVFLRTRIHPTLETLPDSATWPSFDDLYEQLETFEEIYDRIVETLLREVENDSLVYAVPGHPLFGEATVRRLLQVAGERQVPVRVLPGISFLDTVVTALGIDPVETRLQIVDALDLVSVTEAQPYAGGTLPLSPLRPACIAQIYSRSIASHAKLALLRVYPDDLIVTMLQATGSATCEIRTLPLYEIDHHEVNHLSSLYLPAVDPLTNDRVFEGLQQIIAQLRAPGGCPWDREQTHDSLTRHMIEEAYEVVHAIESESPGDLAEELGDVLLQVLLHAQIAEEAGTFTLEDVIGILASKLVRRHPHVFGDRVIDSSGEVVKAWDRIKEQERAGKGAAASESLFGVIPSSLPALARAQTLFRRADSRGYDAVLGAGKVSTAMTNENDGNEARVAQKLATIVRDSETKGVDAEQALRHWTEQFEKVARVDGSAEG